MTVMSEPLVPLSGSQRITAWCMAGIVLLLCVTAIGYRFLHPDLLTPLHLPREDTAPRAMAGMDEDVVALMRQLQANPGDMPALISLTEHFMHTGDWASAERFARRAASTAPDEIKPHYLLSMALHALERNEEAAASLERALQLKEEAVLRYSLGILYAYHLNDKQKGIAQFRRGLADPAAPDWLKADLEKELTELEREQN